MMTRELLSLNRIAECKSASFIIQENKKYHIYADLETKQKPLTVT